MGGNINGGDFITELQGGSRIMHLNLIHVEEEIVHLNIYLFHFNEIKTMGWKLNQQNNLV